jgi:two-component system, LuxR family, sensor kinase FixL
MSGFDSAAAAGAILASLLEASDDAVITTDLSGIVSRWSSGAARLYGFSADGIVGRSIDLLLPEGTHPTLTSEYARVNSGERVDLGETVHRTRDGRLLDVSATLSPVRDEAGQVVAVLSVSRDMRRQKQSEAELQSSQERWRALLASAVDGIVVIDAGGRIEAFNPAAERMFGYTEPEVIGRDVTVLMPSPYREEHASYMSRYLRGGEARIIGKGREVTGRRRDGATFPVHLAVGEMVLQGERKFTGILHDLTTRARMEDQLREQAALVRLGEMAAVIAHEVKNPLAGIRGAIQVIGGRLPPDSAEAGVSKEIVARIDALDDLMKDMLLFARPPQPKLLPVDVRALINTTVELLSADPAMTDVEVAVTGDSPTVAADAGLLKIVFVNLLMNGAHAMQGQGRIDVTIAEERDACVVTFRDAGPGIPSEVREKVFTPFFTTKARGTGLGLPTARRLADAHRGNISIDCPPQGGTAVTVRVPLSH